MQHKKMHFLSRNKLIFCMSRTIHRGYLSKAGQSTRLYNGYGIFWQIEELKFYI